MKGGKPTPGKLTSITALANDTLGSVTDGYDEWAALLRTMSRNYKYGFADQVLIHAQRPDASACAEYDVWTERMRRYVRRGAKGIALVDYSGNVPRLRYVFDVSDTGARRNSRPFRPWTVNDGNLGEVQLGLRQDFGAEGEWLSSQLQDAARDLAEMYYNAHRHDIGGIVDGSLMAGYDDSELRDSFIRAASTSTAYALISRCGYDPEAYFAPEDFAFLNVPIYNGTAREAKERGELDKFKASAEADENCKTAIENAIARNYDGSRLNTSAAIREVREQFGEKRLARVTASLIANRPHDGRISPENKTWAERNATTKKVFTDRTHSGLLDIFAIRLREDLVKKRERGAER